MNNQLRHVVHPFKIIQDENSEILILGSVPSVKSIDNKFYYGNPTNRFWQIMSTIYNFDFVNSSSITKREMMMKNKVALYDVVYSCDIIGSDDSKIYNIVVSDIDAIIKDTKINRIFINGDKAYQIFKTYFPHLLNMATKLPSTSPRNARFNLEKLCNEWKIIK